MKIRALLLLSMSSHAQELTTGGVNAGGSLTTGGAVEITGSLGGFGDVTTGGDTTARGGFPGQIYDPLRVAITPGDAVLVENSAAAFTAEVICDDDSVLPATAVTWSVDSFLLNVTMEGLVTAALLPQDFAGTLTAGAAGVTGTAALSVLDSDPDNYGSYAADGLPDAWQTLHFGYSNPDAAPTTDPDHDGQNNQTEWLAGTDPTDPNSLLHFAFDTNPSPPGIAALVFSPWLPDRTYILEWSATLEAPWTTLPVQPTEAQVHGDGLLTDNFATESRKLYRLRITVP